MDSNLTNLLNRCQLVGNTARNIIEKYSHTLRPDIQTELNRLANRAREYEHGTFIILVVGPAKSGKSTLVNLISGAYVSPTSFLECTVRPSVISRRKEGQESSLTVYSGTDNATKLDKIDSIIDMIRGFGSEEDLSGVISERLPLTEENIRQRVQLGLERSLDSENLLTSICTPGGPLLQERVFVIDMPGFDGAYQNIDNPVYETIAQRADLIIFVQSSNAAFSKVSKEFLNVLAKNNKNVPVCLVHNVFDASWWRPAEDKKADIETQCAFACSRIRELGFRIDQGNHFCINLGAVEDYRKGLNDEGGKLEASNTEFDVMERMMFDRIINHRDSMRLANSLSRVAQQRDKIVDRVQNRIANLQKLFKSYDEECQRLDSIRKDVSMSSPVLPQPDLSQIERIVTLEFRTQSNGINISIKKGNSDTKKIVNRSVEAVNITLNSELENIFKLSQIADEIYRDYRNRLTNLECAFAPYTCIPRATIAPRRSLATDAKFDISSHINIANIVPKKKMIGFLNGSHTGSEIVEYINVIREQLAPIHEQGQLPEPGILTRTDVKQITAAIENEVEKLVEYYRQDLTSYYDDARRKILSNIILSTETAERECETLINLSSDLKKLSV